MIEREIVSYDTEQAYNLNVFHNAVAAQRVLKETLNNSGADVLTLFWERPDVESHGVVKTFLDKQFVTEMNRLVFFLYMGLRGEGLGSEAIDILENETLPQRVNHERLMEIDREFEL